MENASPGPVLLRCSIHWGDLKEMRRPPNLAHSDSYPLREVGRRFLLDLGKSSAHSLPTWEQRRGMPSDPTSPAPFRVFRAFRG